MINKRRVAMIGSPLAMSSIMIAAILAKCPPLAIDKPTPPSGNRIVYVAKQVGGQYCGVSKGYQHAKKKGYTKLGTKHQMVEYVFPEGEYNQLWFVGFFAVLLGHSVLHSSSGPHRELRNQLHVDFKYPSDTARERAHSAIDYLMRLSHTTLTEFIRTGVLK